MTTLSTLLTFKETPNQEAIWAEVCWKKGGREADKVQFKQLLCFEWIRTASSVTSGCGGDPVMPDITLPLQNPYWNNESVQLSTTTSWADYNSHMLPASRLRSWTSHMLFAAPSVTANLPSSLKEYLQIWLSQPTCLGLENLQRHMVPKPQTPITKCTALHVMHVSNIVLGTKLSIICGCYSPQPVYSESHSNQSQLVGTTQSHELADWNIVWVCWGQMCWGYENVLFTKSTNLKTWRILLKTKTTWQPNN